MNADVVIGLGISTDDLLTIDSTNDIKVGLNGNKGKSNEAKVESDTTVKLGDKIEADNSIDTAVIA